MELDFETLNKFKDFAEFMQSWSIENGLNRSQLNYDLFVELWEKEYKNQSFLVEASDFIETFVFQIDEKWNRDYLIPFQNVSICYLFEELTEGMEELKNKISSQPELKEIYQDRLLGHFQEQINSYNQYLLNQESNYEKYKWTCLFYVFLLIASIEDFLLTRHVFKSEDYVGVRRYNYLCCPSKVHFEIKPEETIRIFIDSFIPEEGDSFYWRMIQDLGKLEPKSRKVYFFTLNENLPSDLFTGDADCNLQFVTTKYIKNKCYVNNDKVRTIEELLCLCKAASDYWHNYKFSKKEILKIKKFLEEKLDNYSSFKLLSNWYQKHIDNLNILLPEGEENISVENVSSSENFLKGAETEQWKLEKFKEFIHDWQIDNGYKETASPCSLFLEAWEAKYKRRSFLEIGSYFIEDLLEAFENTWKDEWINPFQDACASYLQNELQIEQQLEKEIIITFLKSQKNDPITLLNSIRNDYQHVNCTLEKLQIVLTNLTDYKDIYNEFLFKLNDKHDEWQRDILHFAILQISALEEFLMTESHGGSGQIKYLFSPSPMHLKINSKETMIIVVKDERRRENRAIYQLNKQKDAINKYIFTVAVDLPFTFFSLCADEGIKVVTTKAIKEKWYFSNNRVMTLENLLVLCKSKELFWQNHNWSRKEREEIKFFLEQELNEVIESTILTKWYKKQINWLENYEYGK